MTYLRLGLVAAGVVSFAYALNTNNAAARWVAIGCVAAALVLRFVSRMRR